jgi:two-component system nitrate/nitrite response regulator NarL
MAVDKKIHVAILDDHQSIIDGYLFRLGQSPDIEVVVTAKYTDELEALLARTPVDVLLLDVQVSISADNLNPYPILERIPAWLQSYPELSVLVISMYNLPSLLRSVMEVGASGYLLKMIMLPSAIARDPQRERRRIYLSQQAHQNYLSGSLTRRI